MSDQATTTEKSPTGTAAPPQTIKVERADDGVATLWFDCPGKVNVLGDATMKELREVVKDIKADKSIKALIIASAKPDTFVSGADLHELLGFGSIEEAHSLAEDGQAVYSQMENFGIPTVTAIHGPCLGGGLEAALCTTRRIATNSPLTVIGLPEVRLGLIPGLGGTQRLPRLIPVKDALECILEASANNAEKALELGIVDELVDDPSKLMPRARALALELIAGTAKERKIKPAEDPEKLKKLFALMERSIKIRLKGHYPAPLKAVECVRLSQSAPLAEGLANEARFFSELAFGNTSRNLIQFFFSQDFVTRSAARTAERTAKKPLKVLGIVGSGIMGTEISRAAVANGLHVRLKTSSKDKVAELKEREANNPDYVVSADYSVLKDCDIVLEAVLEDVKLKETVLAEIEKYVSEECVIATNTSAIELIELGQNLKHPKRFVGTHFFYPVDKMQLVEVASHPSTSNESNARALGLVTTMQKTPISVKDSTGFIVNRLLTSHILEACRLVEWGVPINWIEDAAVQFGLPMGPFTLVDELGVKLCITVAKELFESFGERFLPPKMMRDNDAAGMIGKSPDNGIYLWDASGRKGDFNPKFLERSNLVLNKEKPDEATMQLIQDRILLPMVDEAARCLEEKVVRKARELDLAMIIGAGFPAFRGGPLRFADQTGIAELIVRLQHVYSMMPISADGADKNASATGADKNADAAGAGPNADATGEPATNNANAIASTQGGKGTMREPSSILLSMNEQGRRFYASGEG